ncbi:DUF362 domain-containing protein [Ruminococcaceae bacterium OttesenSCG-928-L11]|nr:DUF362 domain-containing protein [Ruminococcaceae bacterium OttesenSCG-928-L11]
MEAVVSAVQTDSYDAHILEQAVQTHFSRLNVQDVIRPGMRVCLKPNLLGKHAPEAAVTTHCELVKQVVRRLEAMGVKDIVIADSPGGPYTQGALDGIYRATGMQRVEDETSATLNRDTGHVARKSDEAALCREFSVINPIAEADVVINLPKLKTHGMVMLSAGVKNLLGCVPGLQKPELHFRFQDKADFCRMLLDLSLLVKPVLTIVDAVDSMEGNGPSGGSILHTGMTFASRDVYALDLALCAFTGIPADQVWTVRHAMATGLCPDTPNAIRWAGDAPRPAAFQMPDSRTLDFTSHVPGPLRKSAGAIMGRLFEARPVIDRGKCIGCGKCEESCAPKAVVIRERKARLDASKCIKCYCCHEMCPVQAVRIKRPFFLRK